METNPLKAERKRRGWSQPQIAEVLGVSTRTVSRWELGLTVPYPYYREQLCALFGKDAKELGLLSDLDEHDMREQAPLVQPTASDIPGALSSVNTLLGRQDVFMQVKERLFAGDNVALTALGGLPGIGKTALAVALARDQQVQAHFRDGILWAGLGPHPNRLSLLARWGKLLGIAPSQLEHVNSRQSWDQALRNAIGTRRLLLVIDDAWTAEEALALRVGGPACTYLLTTRQSQVASAFAKEGTIVIPQLAEADGLVLLASFVPQLVQQDTEGTRLLVRALGCLPLALTLMGKYLASQSFTEQPWPLRTVVVRLHKMEERLLTKMRMVPGEGSGSVAESTPLCLHAAIALCDQRLSPQAHTALYVLSVFPPKPNSFSEEAALAASQQPVEALDELWDVGLLENWGSERYALHQAVADYIRAQGKVWAAQKQRREDDGDDSRLTNLFGEQERNDWSATGPSNQIRKEGVDRRLGRVSLESSVHEQGESETSRITSSSTRSTEAPRPWTVRTLRGKRKLLGLVLSVALALMIYTLMPGVITKLYTSSSLTIFTKNNPKANPGVVANSDPYPPSGTLALDDPLSNNSRGYGWYETSPASSNGGWSCQFIGGAYYAQAQNGIYASCGPPVRPSNFTFEAQMQIINGSCGGFTLRDGTYDGRSGDAYSFQVCQDGSYRFNLWRSFHIQTLTSGSSAAIATGSNQSNLIALVANGSHFDLYVNHQKLASADDSSYSSGGFGLTANAAYTNARMWTLPALARSRRP